MPYQVESSAIEFAVQEIFDSLEHPYWPQFFDHCCVMLLTSNDPYFTEEQVYTAVDNVRNRTVTSMRENKIIEREDVLDLAVLLAIYHQKSLQPWNTAVH